MALADTSRRRAPRVSVPPIRIASRRIAALVHLRETPATAPSDTATGGDTFPRNCVFQARVSFVGTGVAETIVALDDPDAGEQLRVAVEAEGLMTIHTEESTLENSFVEMTGRALEA